MPKTVTLRIDDKTYRLFSQKARAENRPLSNYIEVATLAYSTDSSFVDDIEMEEITANKSLLKRLQEGSRDARKMKGKFI